jgi:hypothetical protein
MPYRSGLVLVVSLLGIASRAHAQGGDAEAFEAARPVFEQHCNHCHTDAGNAEAIEHLDMRAYPFGGEHAAMAGMAVREALGATGHAPTMPADDPGAVTGDQLALLLAWADAFDEAHPMAMGGGADAQFPYAVPRETLIPGRPGMAGGFHVMINAFAFLQNVGLDGYAIENAGHSTAGGAVHPALTGDWAMGYWRHPRGWVEAMLMIDLEPFSVGKQGVPELGQAGEGLVDAQHSHQLLHQAMIAAHPIPALSIFAGQGSATIGPPIFMHRASSPGPTVPRKHHKGENPHETFPVIGASYRLGALTIEGSAFSALELGPDDSRLYPHAAAPVSAAARLRYDLWTLAEFQVSGERLRDQGDGVPDAWQVSASAYGDGDLGAWRYDALLDWAVDRADGEDAAQAVLGELAVRDASRREISWTRAEWNQREEADGTVSSPWLFGTLGFEHVLVVGRGLQLGAFAEATVAHVPAGLQDTYGRGTVVSLAAGVHLFGMWMLDQRLRPMAHHHHAEPEPEPDHGHMDMPGM